MSTDDSNARFPIDVKKPVKSASVSKPAKSTRVKKPAARAPAEPHDVNLFHLEVAAAEHKRAVINGDGNALIEALMTWCLIPDERMPKWLSDELFGRLYRYKGYKVRTLDEAFGVNRPKNYPLAAARRTKETALSLYVCVCFLKSAGVKSETAAIHAVGAELFKIGKTTSEKYFREQLALQCGRPNFGSSDPNELPDHLIPIFRMLEPSSRKVKKRGV